MNSGLHREIARQRQADLHREAELARRAAHVRRERPSILSFTPALAKWEALSLLTRRQAHPST
jgi:hypothetical protein